MKKYASLIKANLVTNYMIFKIAFKINQVAYLVTPLLIHFPLYIENMYIFYDFFIK